jgi:hypothetical protein
MKKIILSLMVLLITVSSLLGADLLSQLSAYFRDGDAKKISAYFSPTVTLSILNDHNVYSNVQAEIILDTFFKMNRPVGVKVLHRLDNNPNYQHAVIELKTNKGDYRVSYSTRESNSKSQLVELRIEKTKD